MNNTSNETTSNNNDAVLVFYSERVSIVGYQLLRLNLSAIVYYIFIYPLCLLDIYLYPFIVFVFCFKPIPFNELFSCYKKKTNNDNTTDSSDNTAEDAEKSIISLISQ